MTADEGLLSDALDEIYFLRRALAYEALARKADLEYKTYPKSRRSVADEAVARMQAAARGHVGVAYAYRNESVLRHSLREAGARETLTRWAWQEELPRRSS